MNLIIFGPQGSGKGTQADLLAAKLNIPHISSGQMFRDQALKKTALGLEVQEGLDAGKLISDDLVMAVIKDRLAQADCHLGYILDGTPRTLAQAKTLDTFAKIDQAIEIWINDEEVLKRLGGRRSCKSCGAIYHLVTNPPKISGLCDKCGGTLIIRDDDKEELIIKRLNAYHQQTEPLIHYYQDQGKLIKIDGMPSINEVYQNILAKLSL